MRALRSGNLLLALLLELGLLAAFVVVAVRLDAPWPVRVVVAIALPAAVMVIWGAFFAPRAARRQPPRRRLLLETALFGLAILALASSGLPVVAVVFAALVAVNTVGRARFAQI